MKLGIVPFHFWMPQIYNGTSNFILLILLILPKLVLFFLFFKIYLIVFSFLDNFLYTFFLIISFFSLFTVL